MCLRRHRSCKDVCSVKKQLPYSNTFLPRPLFTQFVGQDMKGKPLLRNVEVIWNLWYEITASPTLDFQIQIYSIWSLPSKVTLPLLLSNSFILNFIPHLFLFIHSLLTVYNSQIISSWTQRSSPFPVLISSYSIFICSSWFPHL